MISFRTSLEQIFFHKAVTTQFALLTLNSSPKRIGYRGTDFDVVICEMCALKWLFGDIYGLLSQTHETLHVALIYGVLHN